MIFEGVNYTACNLHLVNQYERFCMTYITAVNAMLRKKRIDFQWATYLCFVKKQKVYKCLSFTVTCCVTVKEKHLYTLYLFADVKKIK